MMVQDPQDGAFVLLADIVHGGGYGLGSLLAGQGTVDEIVEHVYDKEGAVFHRNKDTQKIVYL